MNVSKKGLPIFKNTVCRQFLCVAVCVFLMSVRTVSALMLPLSTSALVDHSCCIVEGQINGVSSRWTADGAMIVTEVTIDVTDALLGETNRVTFLYEGGVVDGIGQRVSDMPAVTNGQYVLVFLREPTERERVRDRSSSDNMSSLSGLVPQHYVLSGAAQGFYRIEKGRAVKDGFTVAGNAAGVRSNETATSESSISSVDTNDSSVVEYNVDLKDFKSRVRQRVVAKPQSGSRP